MFNPEKDFNRKVIETLGKDGRSISALAKELEAQGIKHHRLILTAPGGNGAGEVEIDVGQFPCGDAGLQLGINRSSPHRPAPRSP